MSNFDWNGDKNEIENSSIFRSFINWLWKRKIFRPLKNFCLFYYYVIRPFSGIVKIFYSFWTYVFGCHFGCSWNFRVLKTVLKSWEKCQTEVYLKLSKFDHKGVKNDIECKFRIVNVACAHTFWVATSAVVGIFEFWKKFWNLEKNAKLEVNSKFSISDCKGVKKAKIFSKTIFLKKFDKRNIFPTPRAGP